jgi:hypothetical protein
LESTKKFRKNPLNHGINVFGFGGKACLRKEENKMDREKAINNLQKKGVISGPKKIVQKKMVKVPKLKKVVSYEDPEFSKEEEKKIQNEMRKNAKVYGDPVVELYD